MRKKPKIIIFIGCIILMVAFLIDRNLPKTDEAVKLLCEQEIDIRFQNKENTAEYVELRARCAESAFATAFTAKDVQLAAKNISSVNQNQVYIITLYNFLLGIGISLLVGGIILYLFRKKNRLIDKINIAMSK